MLPSGRGVRRQHGAIPCIDAPTGGRYSARETFSQASRMAVTPCPPAAQTEIRPRTGCPVSRLLLGELLGQLGDDPAAGRRERMPRGQRRAVDVELGAVDGAERPIQAEALLAVLLGLPRRQRGQHHRRERLVDLVVVEILQRQPVAGQQPRHRIRRRHQQAVAAVDVVHRRGLAVDEVRQHRDRMRGAPTPRRPAAPPTRRRSAASSCPRSSSRRRCARRTPA